MTMLTLLMDNYDSFTYNLFQLLAEVNGTEPIVVRNDEMSWRQLSRLKFDSVVISPGPGRPERQRDFGVCAELIRHCEAPLLGVCLGLQGLGWVNGGAVAGAPEPMHGRVCTVEHSGSPLFAGIPSPLRAVRYHSLCLGRPLPRQLEEIAWSDDGVPMAVAHRSRPQWGVQFHPESVATEHGRRLLENFRNLAGGASRPPAPGGFAARAGTTGSAARARLPLELRWQRLDGPHDPERSFVALYGESQRAFWLDGGRGEHGDRFSFIGDDGGPLGATVFYDVDARQVTVEPGGEAGGAGAAEVRTETIFDYLGAELAYLRQLGDDLPFDFDCGFAGYLGYEAKADCGGDRAHGSPLPDAAFVFAGRMVAFDFETEQTYLLCLVEPGQRASADAWFEATEAGLAVATGQASADPGADGEAFPAAADPEPRFSLARSRERYLEDIAACQRRLREGESYEVCLTNTISTPLEADPLELYGRLRRINPAPFAAYLRFDDLAVLSSSPERFLRVDRERGVESKPIKGTSRRGRDAAEDARLADRLREDQKSRAENLMIADLVRNDLGSVCEVGSVRVPSLIEVESYETVHQLVTTVRGRLRADRQAVDCVRACFPPGSMTGAPKLRTMEILDQLEGEARGVYAGAIGYLGAGGGCDLSVAIRAIVLDGRSASIGAGGAIVLQSDPVAEYGEMLLKAAAPLRAIQAGADPATISLAGPRPVAAHVRRRHPTT